MGKGLKNQGIFFGNKLQSQQGNSIKKLSCYLDVIHCMCLTVILIKEGIPYNCMSRKHVCQSTFKQSDQHVEI